MNDEITRREENFYTDYPVDFQFDELFLLLRYHDHSYYQTTDEFQNVDLIVLSSQGIGVLMLHSVQLKSFLGEKMLIDNNDNDLHMVSR